MSNGAIDKAEVEAILSSGQREKIDRYLVESVHQLTTVVEKFPAVVAEAIHSHRTACRAQSRKRVAVVASAVGATVGFLTPYVIHFL